MSGLSIKAFTKEKKTEKRTDIHSENLPKSDFTHEQFLQVWKKYLELLSNSGTNRSLVSCLNGITLALSGHKIMMKVENKTLQNRIEDQLPQMLKFIREKLNNHHITFELEVHQTKSTPQAAYTPEEKLQFLVKRNPKVLKLNKVLNLRLE